MLHTTFISFYSLEHCVAALLWKLVFSSFFLSLLFPYLVYNDGVSFSFICWLMGFSVRYLLPYFLCCSCIYGRIDIFIPLSSLCFDYYIHHGKSFNIVNIVRVTLNDKHFRVECKRALLFISIFILRKAQK